MSKETVPIVEDYGVFKLSHPTHPEGQWTTVFTLENGKKITKRLKGMYCTPGVNKITDEPQQYQNQVHLAAFNKMMEVFAQGPAAINPCKYKSCTAAMEAFEKEKNRDYHGNSFKEYFSDKAISEVPGSVQQFVEWLLEKYNRTEGTVCKKVFAASAMFRWLIRSKEWTKENPFHLALEDVKFAPRKRIKSIIETAEYERLGQTMQDDRFKELRIITALMFYCGLRPSEAYDIEWKMIDPTRLTLTYLRTKRKNKTPDWRRIPIPAQIVALLVNEGRAEGKLIRVGKSGLRFQMKHATDAAQVGGVTLKTYRKDFAYRARMCGASRDDLNLYQGRDESVLEEHYLTDEWYIVHQCRPWIEKMFSEKPSITRVK